MGFTGSALRKILSSCSCSAASCPCPASVCFLLSFALSVCSILRALACLALFSAPGVPVICTSITHVALKNMTDFGECARYPFRSHSAIALVALPCISATQPCLYGFWNAVPEPGRNLLEQNRQDVYMNVPSMWIARTLQIPVKVFDSGEDKVMLHIMEQLAKS